MDKDSKNNNAPEWGSYMFAVGAVYAAIGATIYVKTGHDLGSAILLFFCGCIAFAMIAGAGFSAVDKFRNIKGKWERLLFTFAALVVAGVCIGLFICVNLHIGK